MSIFIELIPSEVTFFVVAKSLTFKVQIQHGIIIGNYVFIKVESPSESVI